jgi:hypothetical protein
MKWFLVCLIFYVAAAGLSRYWFREAAFSQAIAQQQGSSFNSAGGMSYEKTKAKKCYGSRANAIPDRCRSAQRR